MNRNLPYIDHCMEQRSKQEKVWMTGETFLRYNNIKHFLFLMIKTWVNEFAETDETFVFGLNFCRSQSR